MNPGSTPTPRRRLALGIALILAPVVSAQVVVDFGASTLLEPGPERTLHREGARPPRPTPRVTKRATKPKVEQVPTPTAETSPLGNLVALAGSESPLRPVRRAFEDFVMAAIAPPPPPSIVLDTFDAVTGTGSVRPSTSWVGQVTQNSSSITVGGTARDDNGWGASSLTINATGMLYVNVTAQRNAGHTATSLFLQLEDRAASTNTHIVSFDASVFAFGTPTLAQVPLGTLSSEFLLGSIGSWSIGGGGVGIEDFRMTLHNLELTATAIPEPVTVATFLGLAVLGVAVYQRRKVRSTSSSPR